MALVKDAKVAFDDVSIFLSSKKRRSATCCVAGRGRPPTRTKGFTCRREARRGEGLATLLVKLWLCIAQELGCGINNAGHRQARRCRYFWRAAGLEPRSSKFEVDAASEARAEPVVEVDAMSRASRSHGRVTHAG